MQFNLEDSESLRRFYLGCALAGGRNSDEALSEADRAVELLKERQVIGERGHSSAPETSETLVIKVYRSSANAVDKAIIAYQGRTSILQSDPAEALLLLARLGNITVADFKSWASDGEARAYNALKVLKVRLKEIGLPDAIKSKRGHGYYWGQEIPIEITDA